MNTKVCTRCKVAYPATAKFFSKNKQHRDGFQSYCRVCGLASDARWRAANPERKTRWRAEHREAAIRYNARWQKAHPEIVKAHHDANHAFKAGRLTCPTACERCSKVGRLHKHHPDYSKPLEVVVLCPRCHAQHHLDLARQQKGVSA